VFRLALPLIVSNGFWTAQITIDRILLSRDESKAVGAALSGVVLFWTVFVLFQTTALYATTFVAQYAGAGRRDRVGPAVWQSLYFSVLSGLGLLLLIPLVGPVIALGNQPADLQEMEATYLRCLIVAALPMLLVASATSFFLGRGKTWMVVLVNALGMAINAVLDYALISGNWGFPRWGIEGAGWATVAGAWVSALLALALFLLPRFRAEFGTWSGWRFDRELFDRMLRFGLPAGVQLMIEGLALYAVTFLIRLQGPAALSATSVAFTMNLISFLPTMGIAQAVQILVGQRLGEDRPETAERSAWAGFALAWTVMTLIGLSYVLIPDLYLSLFRPEGPDETWPAVAALVPVLLRFVALYCLFDSMNLVFAFALRGAGDTRFVTVVTLAVAWPVMVFPTWLAWYHNLGLYWSWAAITAYVICLAFTFLARFRRGKWKAMRVIERTGPAPEHEPATPVAPREVQVTGAVALGDSDA
jgi:MATE family multidrug resistance protein